MPLYRLLYLDNHRLIRAEELDAPDDEEAVVRSEQRFDGHAFELWSGSRRIKSFPAARESRAHGTPPRPTDG